MDDQPADKKPIVFIEPGLPVWGREDINIAEKAIYMYFANRQGRKGKVWVGIEAAAKAMRLSEGYTRECLARLRVVGLMVNVGQRKEGTTMTRRVILPDDIDYPAQACQRPRRKRKPKKPKAGAGMPAPDLRHASASPMVYQRPGRLHASAISTHVSAQVSTQESTHQEQSTSEAKVADIVPTKPKAPKKPEPRPPDPGPEPNCLDDVEGHKKWAAETTALRQWKDAR